MRPDAGQRCLVAYKSRMKPCVDQFTGQVVTVSLPIVDAAGVWWTYIEPNRQCRLCARRLDTLPEDCLQPLPPETAEPPEQKITEPELTPKHQKQFVR